MMKDINLTVGYCWVHLHILPLLLQFIKMMCNQLIDNLLIGNKRDKIHPFFVDSSSYQTFRNKEV